MTTGVMTYDEIARGLDLRSIRATGAEIAALLGQKIPVGVSYQPNNGTAYALIFTPVRSIEQISKWTVPGGVHDENGLALTGMTVVAKVEGTTWAWPFDLRPGRRAQWTYVAEKIQTDSWGDAAAITALLRAVSGVSILDADA